MEITLITGNQTKLKNANLNLNNFGIQVEGREIDTPEIQSTKPEEIAEHSAKYAYSIVGKPVIKMDVSFEIDCLKGFPGPFVKFINQWLDPNDILKMIGSSKNRRARFIDVLSYVGGQDAQIKSFRMVKNGVISAKPLGENGWGIDKIFIPDGFNKTLAEMDDSERVTVWGNSHWEDLATYIKSLKS
jgi:non-canonical purine NTP pyrophosphatase (RdgB/HAM1 family)